MKTHCFALAVLALCACRREPTAVANTAQDTPNGVARWHIVDPAERVRDGAILVEPPALARQMVPAVPSLLREAANHCAAFAPTRGEERVEVHFDVERDQRITHGSAVIGGALANCIVEALSRRTTDSHGERARVVARLVVSAVEAPDAGR